MILVYAFAIYGLGVLVGYTYSFFAFKSNRSEEFVLLSLALSAVWPFYLVLEVNELVTKWRRKT